MRIRKSVVTLAAVVCAGIGAAAGCTAAPMAPDTAGVTFGAGGGALQSRAPSKVDICHVNGKGDYNKITVAANAEPAHLAHGDRHPGDPAPGTSGSSASSYYLDANCKIVSGPPPCGGSGSSSVCTSSGS